MSKLIIVILLASLIGVCFKCVKMRHDVIYGAIQINNDIYSCSKWKYIPDKRR